MNFTHYSETTKVSIILTNLTRNWKEKIIFVFSALDELCTVQQIKQNSIILGNLTRNWELKNDYQHISFLSAEK